MSARDEDPAVVLPLSAERLAEIEERANAATDGPWCTDSWEIYQGSEYEPGLSFWIGETCRGTADLEQDRADAAFVAAARSDVPELVAEVHRQAGVIAGLEAQRERRRLRLIALDNDALSMRGSLSPMGEGRKVPFPLGETLTPAVDWLIARVAELEALTPAAIQTCRVCGAGYSYGEPCQACAFKAQMAAEVAARVERPVNRLTEMFAPTQALQERPGEFYGFVHHPYTTPHDMPETGGQR